MVSYDVSYVAILKDFKKRAKPDELGVPIQGIRETCFKDLLVELRRSEGGRGQLYSASKEFIGAGGSVRHPISRIGVKIAVIDHSTEAENVEEAVRGRKYPTFMNRCL